MRMEIPFIHLGHPGRVIASLETTLSPAAVGAREGAAGLASCQAVVEFPARGYLGLLGWIQLVSSSDNSSHGRQFEMDPFDVFDLEKKDPSPYSWYGIIPPCSMPPPPVIGQTWIGWLPVFSPPLPCAASGASPPRCAATAAS
jgi:hypothetical protein